MMSEKSMMPGTQPTESLCPVCLRRIPAFRVFSGHGSDVYLEKDCPDHGHFRTRIWKGLPDFLDWRRPKIPTTPLVPGTAVERGCPFDCGLCPRHRQRSCTILLEVTGRCNLSCPVCFADAGHCPEDDPSLDTIATWFKAAKTAGGNCNIQLSGGEPTLRDDLPEIVAMGREAGFSFIQVNTNGLRPAADRRYVAALKQAGLSSVFLQFDGLDNTIHEKLRGRPLLEAKMEALRWFREFNIGVVLVPTLVPGINTDAVGDILTMAVEWSPTVRGVHFQPVSYFGRYPDIPDSDDQSRLTLPELMQAIDSQTGGMFRAHQFKPPGCENAWCSFHASYLITPGRKAMPVGSARGQGLTCCEEPVRAEEGAARAIAHVARQWAGPGEPPAADDSPQKMKSSVSGPMSLDAFISRARTHLFSVSAMAFQDAGNLDLDRVRDCCIHVMSPDRRLIPFCLYNLTSTRGQRLYRP